MNKRYGCICFLIGTVFLFLGCAPSYYGIIKEGTASASLNDYKTIGVGWIDLGEGNWKAFGYDSKKKWTDYISEMNLTAMPQYMKEWMPGKDFTFSKSRKSSLPKSGLMIKFSDVKYVPRTSTAAKIMFGSMAGSDTLDLTIQFIDGKSGKSLYSSQISVYSKSASDAWGSSFEGRINNCIYNLARYISEKAG